MAKLTSSEIEKAIDTLKAGGVVVIPTETCYGLAADATNERAVQRVLTIKGRGPVKQPPVLVADMEMALAHGNFCQRMRGIAKQFWPGPLNIVVPKKKDSSIVVGDNDNQVALRVTAHPVVRELIKSMGKPITATSANRTGQADCYSIRDWRKQYAGRSLQPDYILDAGALPKNPPSTIIKKEDGKIVVARQGAIELPEKYA